LYKNCWRFFTAQVIYRKKQRVAALNYGLAHSHSMSRPMVLAINDNHVFGATNV
jgi:hypothetical protein